MRSDDFTKQVAREALYRLSPPSWSARVLGVHLDPWQEKQVSASAAARHLLGPPPAGKTTGGSVAVAHTMVYRSPGSTSLVLAPTQKQSAEFVRRTRENLLKAGQKLTVDNTFGVEIENGSRCLALPGQDDAGIRGLTISGGDLVIDEAARVDDRLYDAARPMLIRFARTARLILLSTAWAKEGFFYRVWSEGDLRDWIKIEAKVSECRHISPEEIERERRAMPASVFAREYMNQFDALESRFFSADAIAAAFGAVIGPSPDPEEGSDDPVVIRRPVFNQRVLA